MARILLTKHRHTELTGDQRAAVRAVLFGVVDGMGEADRRRWRRLWQFLLDAEPGEVVELYTRRARDPGFHGMHMKLETTVFEAQEKFPTMDGFRDWIKTGACFVDWQVSPKGELRAVPRSTSYDSLEQDDYEEFHLNVVKFLRTEYAHRTLWPHLGDRLGSEMVETLLRSFERDPT
jgi:hypothetical protein